MNARCLPNRCAHAPCVSHHLEPNLTPQSSFRAPWPSPDTNFQRHPLHTGITATVRENRESRSLRPLALLTSFAYASHAKQTPSTLTPQAPSLGWYCLGPRYGLNGTELAATNSNYYSEGPAYSGTGCVWNECTPQSPPLVALVIFISERFHAQSSPMKERSCGGAG